MIIWWCSWHLYVTSLMTCCSACTATQFNEYENIRINIVNMFQLQQLHQQLADIMIVVSRMLNDEQEMMKIPEVSRAKQQYLVILVIVLLIISDSLWCISRSTKSFSFRCIIIQECIKLPPTNILAKCYYYEGYNQVFNHFLQFK